MTEVRKATTGTGGDGAATVPISEIAGATTLKRNILSMPEVMAQSVANMAPTAAMALLPLLVYFNAGNGTWLSFLIAVVLMGCVGYCAVQFAKRMQSAGSFYVWVTHGLGPGAGHIAGWGLQLGYIATGMATIYGVGIFGADFIHRFIPGVDPLNPFLLAALFLLDVGVMVTLAITDIQLSARTALTLEAISITAVLILVVSTWVVRGPIDTAQFSFKGVVPGGIITGIVLAIFAFVGFESAGSLGMEAKNPYKNIGRAILWSAIIIGCFYVVVSYSQVLGFQPTNGGYAKSSAPMPDLAALIGLGGILDKVIALGLTISAGACTLACINASARIALTMSHDGMGVPALTRTGLKRTPYVAIWTVAVPMIAFPLLTTILRQSPIDGTGWTGTIATFGFMTGYALVAFAAPLYLRRINQASPLVWVTGLVGLVSMIIVFWASWKPEWITAILPFLPFPPISGVYAWLPPVFVLWVAIGLAWYLIIRRTQPHVASALGTRYETVEQHTAQAG